MRNPSWYNQHNSRIIIYSANLCSILPPNVIYYSSVQNTLSELIRCVKYDETQSLLISHTQTIYRYINVLVARLPKTTPFFFCFDKPN